MPTKKESKTPAVSKKRSKWNILLLVLITCLVLYFSLKDNFNEIMKEFMTLNPFWIFVGFFLILSFYFFKAWGLQHLVLRYKKGYRFRSAFKMILNTQFFNAITPFSTGGQPFQIYMFSKDGIHVLDGTNIVVQNFIVYQIALVLLGTFAIVANHFGNFLAESSVLKELVTLGFVINFIVIIGLFVISFAKKFNQMVTKKIINLLTRFKLVKNPEKTKKDWEDYLNRFHKGAKILIQDKVFFVKAILANMIALICEYLIPLVIIYSMGDYTSINGLQTIMTSAYVMLIGSFVPIPGGTGGLEYGYVAFFGNFLTGSILKASMLMWRFITYYFGMILGAVILNLKGSRN